MGICLVLGFDEFGEDDDLVSDVFWHATGEVVDGEAKEFELQVLAEDEHFLTSGRQVDVFRVGRDITRDGVFTKVPEMPLKNGAVSRMKDILDDMSVVK